MTDRELVRSYIERAAVPADGDLGRYVRDRVDEARPHAHAGAEVTALDLDLLELLIRELGDEV